jgi:hypothetical protein
MSLCNQILDFADDTNKELLKEILKEQKLPDMVKTAQVATRETQEKLAQAEFALVAFTTDGSELRKYPVNDAANTWLSCHYFEKTGHKLPKVARKIAAVMLKRACAIYDVPESRSLAFYLTDHHANPKTNVYRENSDMTKTAQPIMVEVVTPDNSKHFYALEGRYAMPNPEFVKKAGEYFVVNEKGFADPLDRHTYAHNVLERAKELKVELEQKEILSKYAAADYGDILEVQMHMRADLLDAKPQLKEALVKVSSYKKELAPVEFAKLLHTFDKRASLDKYYGHYLADAYKATFETRFTKTASGYSWESEDGVSVSEKELTKTFDDKYDKVKGYFGPTVANELKKHGCAIFDSLPKDAKEVITKIAKGQI